MTKQCTACGEFKDLESFGLQKRGLHGKRSKCKKCVNKYNTCYSKKRWDLDEKFREKRIAYAVLWSKNNPEKRAIIAKNRNKRAAIKHGDKLKARALVNQRVRFGRIPKAASLLCNLCGGQAKHYHHYNGYAFEHRYDIIPLCVKCHIKEDA